MVPLKMTLIYARIAYRTSPTFRGRFKFTALPRFMERHGVLEKKTVEKEYEVRNKGQTTPVTRRWSQAATPTSRS